MVASRVQVSNFSDNSRDFRKELRLDRISKESHGVREWTKTKHAIPQNCFCGEEKWGSHKEGLLWMKSITISVSDKLLTSTAKEY